MADEDIKPEPPYFCPRCDRPYLTFKALEKHVGRQHPDHDPNWAGQYDREKDKK